MLNFLQQKNKKQIIFEYLLRIAVFLLLFIFASSLILISLFIPSFFFVKYKNDTINNQLISAKQASISRGEDPVLFIKNINTLSVALYNNTSSSFTYSEIINKVVSLKNNDIKISSIIVTNDSGVSGKKILINGVASTRDGLSLYEKEIKTDGSFDSVVFPVSDFIKSSDSEFSATLIYKNK